MEPVSREKFQVAWFKLAEFIDRGERERAFTIHKLLMHTVDAQAYAHHLEGDLLFFFNDPNALACYEKAAQIYHRDGNLSQAAAMYEYLIRIKIDEPLFLDQLISLYQELGHPTRTFFGTQQLIKHFVNSKQATTAYKAIEKLSSVLTPHDYARLYQDLTNILIDKKYNDPELINMCIHKTLTLFATNSIYKKNFLDSLCKRNIKWSTHLPEKLL